MRTALLGLTKKVDMTDVKEICSDCTIYMRAFYVFGLFGCLDWRARALWSVLAVFDTRVFTHFQRTFDSTSRANAFDNLPRAHSLHCWQHMKHACIGNFGCSLRICCISVAYNTQIQRVLPHPIHGGYPRCTSENVVNDATVFEHSSPEIGWHQRWVAAVCLDRLIVWYAYHEFVAQLFGVFQ
jgi:hypothetical protein